MTKNLLATALNCDPADILTTAEAAAILSVTARAVTAAAKRGALVGYKIGEGRGGTWYFVRADVEQYAANKQTWRTTPPAPSGGSGTDEGC
jgi:excisionase family DNA binding protein